MDKIKLIFPADYFKNTDTASEGINNVFSSIHFSYYNRYSEQVKLFVFLLYFPAHLFLFRATILQLTSILALSSSLARSAP